MGKVYSLPIFKHLLCEFTLTFLRMFTGIVHAIFFKKNFFKKAQVSSTNEQLTFSTVNSLFFDAFRLHSTDFFMEFKKVATPLFILPI